VVAVATQPIDELVLRIIAKDAAGRLLLDLVSEQGPVRQALVQSASMLRSNLPNMAACLLGIPLDSPPIAAHLDLFRSIIVRLAAAAHARLHLAFGQWPYKLLILVSASASDAEKMASAQELFDCPVCCLDDPFSLRLRALAGNPEGMLREDILGLLRAWGDRGKVRSRHSGAGVCGHVGGRCRFLWAVGIECRERLAVGGSGGAQGCPPPVRGGLLARRRREPGPRRWPPAGSSVPRHRAASGYHPHW